MTNRRLESAARMVSPWGLGFLAVGLLACAAAFALDDRRAQDAVMKLLCVGTLATATGVAMLLQFRRDRLDREAEARSQIVRGDRVFRVLIQVPQEVGKEDKLRSALDVETSEPHRGIAPLLEASAHAMRIEVRELADLDQDFTVYASDVMRKALRPFGEEVQTYRETSETKKEGYLTLVTWLLFVRLPGTPLELPRQRDLLRAWLDALIPPHPEDTLVSQVACSVPLHDLELAELAARGEWMEFRG